VANAGSDWDDVVDSDAEEAEIWKVRKQMLGWPKAGTYAIKQAMNATLPKADGDEDLMENSEDDLVEEDVDEDINFDDDSELAPSNEEDEDVGDENKADESDDEEALSLVEASDNEDLVSLDGDVPEGLIEHDGSDVSDEEAVEEREWDGISGSAGNAKKRKSEESKGGKRKKLRSLPTFASYDDYAKLIEEGPEDDIWRN